MCVCVYCMCFFVWTALPDNHVPHPIRRPTHMVELNRIACGLPRNIIGKVEKFITYPAYISEIRPGNLR